MAIDWNKTNQNWNSRLYSWFVFYIKIKMYIFFSGHDNECKNANGGCQELCLYRGEGKVTCACSHGNLAADGTSCERKFILPHHFLFFISCGFELYFNWKLIFSFLIQLNYYDSPLHKNLLNSFLLLYQLVLNIKSIYYRL